jgi:hypothetical protein
VPILRDPAGVAELADAMGLGPIGLRSLEVRVLPPALVRKVGIRPAADSDRVRPLRRRRFAAAIASLPSTEASQFEEVDVVAGLAVEHEVGEDLAHDRAELETVTREPGCDDCEVGLGMPVEEEVLVR